MTFGTTLVDKSRAYFLKCAACTVHIYVYHIHSSSSDGDRAECAHTAKGSYEERGEKIEVGELLVILGQKLSPYPFVLE